MRIVGFFQIDEISSPQQISISFSHQCQLSFTQNSTYFSSYSIMLILTLVINVDQGKVNDDVLKTSSKFMADLFDDTEQNVFVSIKAEVQMAWGTKPGLFALGTVQNTVPFNAEDSQFYAPQIFEFVEKTFGVPQNRMYLGFITVNPDNVGNEGIITSIMDEQ